MAHWIGEANRTFTDQEIHPMLVPMEEGWDSDNHLEDEDSKRPPVDSKVVTISNEHLRSQILSCAAEGVRELTLLHELGETEVSHKKVTCSSKDISVRPNKK